jgi:hypothetical protein
MGGVDRYLVSPEKQDFQSGQLKNGYVERISCRMNTA